MGKIVSKISRSVNRFNVENRAHRVIQKEKPELAPRYKTDEEMMKTLEADPSISEKLHRKDPSLYDRLKEVYVTSENKIIEREQNNLNENIKSLPLNREIVEEFEFGIKEPIKVPVGRVTLRQVLKFIEDNKQDSAAWNSETISTHYKLKPEEVDNILKYYNIFQVYKPETKKSKVVFASSIKSDPLRLNEKRKESNE